MSRPLLVGTNERKGMTTCEQEDVAMVIDLHCKIANHACDQKKIQFLGHADIHSCPVTPG